MKFGVKPFIMNAVGVLSRFISDSLKSSHYPLSGYKIAMKLSSIQFFRCDLLDFPKALSTFSANPGVARQSVHERRMSFLKTEFVQIITESVR